MNKPPPPATLEDTLAQAFALLSRGVADRRHGFHTPVLATIGAGGAPEARVLVLRGFHAAGRRLRLHTDARAAKVAALEAEPRAALLFYDPGAQLQLRVAGHATLHRDDAVADDAWTGSREFSRMCYAIDPAPGTAVTAPPAAPLDSGAGRPHFCVVMLQIHRLESLHLAASGHRRAGFDWDATGVLAATWLVP
jgi:hypothetical protein